MDQLGGTLLLPTSCFGGMLARVRLQSAIVQTLLDELRLQSSAPAIETALMEQLFDELERLQEDARSARVAIAGRDVAPDAFESSGGEPACSGLAPRRVA